MFLRISILDNDFSFYNFPSSEFFQVFCLDFILYFFRVLFKVQVYNWLKRFYIWFAFVIHLLSYFHMLCLSFSRRSIKICGGLKFFSGLLNVRSSADLQIGWHFKFWAATQREIWLNSFREDQQTDRWTKAAEWMCYINALFVYYSECQL